MAVSIIKLLTDEKYILEEECIKELNNKINSPQMVENALNYIYTAIESFLEKLRNKPIYFKLINCKKISESKELEKEIKSFDNQIKIIIRNSIHKALANENPNLYALKAKIRDILNNLLILKKVFLAQKDSEKRNRSSARMFKLVNQNIEKVFLFKDSNDKNRILNYTKEIELDKKYELIINPPGEEKNFNCTNDIALVINDFFTNTTPPRPTADYIWKPIEAAKIIISLYKENYEYRINTINNKINSSNDDKEKEKYQKQLNELKDEYRAQFDFKTYSISKQNEEDSDEENTEIDYADSIDVESEAIDDTYDEEKVKEWVKESISILNTLKRKKGLLVFLINIILEEPERIKNLDNETKEKLTNSFYNRKSTPTKFFANFLNISEGSISNYTDDMKIFIIRRFRKLNYEDYVNDHQKYINIPHIHEKAFNLFWNEIAKYFKAELEEKL